MSLVYNNKKFIGKCSKFAIEKVQGTSPFVMLENFEPKQPQLNENQQIVLEWLKEEHFDSYIKSVLSNLYFYVNMTAIGDLENKEIQEMVNTYEKLSQEEFAQVLQVFSTWALEQEED